MTAILQALYDFMVQLVCWIMLALISALNLVIAALAGTVQALLDAWPIDMPELPAVPPAFSEGLSWVGFFFPLGTLVDVLLFIIGVQLLWFGLSIVLRWAKALGDG